MYENLFELIYHSGMMALLVCVSLFVRQGCIYAGQFWAQTLSHTATLAILPVVTYTVTNVISGNIALSLGMVGALSIVRFRNPVKSPLELTLYFVCISLGIIGAARPLWIGVLVAGLLTAIALMLIAAFFQRQMFGTNFTFASFSEGNERKLLEFQLTSAEHSALLSAGVSFSNLVSARKNGSQLVFVLAFANVEDALHFGSIVTQIVPEFDYRLS